MITTPLRVGSLLNLRTDDTSVCPAVSAPFVVSLSLIALSVLLSTSTTLQFINQRKVKLRRDGCCTAAAAAKSTKWTPPCRAGRPHRLGWTAALPRTVNRQPTVYSDGYCFRTTTN